MQLSSIYSTKTPEETLALGRRLASRLKLGDSVLLFGDLGAGKTHFTKGIAEGLGLKSTIKSPTFAYVNHYPLAENSTFYHYDLYRLHQGDDFSSIGLEESLIDEKAINVVEWADRMGDDLPQSYVRVELESGESEHKITIRFLDNGNYSEEKMQEYYDFWSTPMHVRRHTKQVSTVAKQIAEAYISKGEIVDLDHLYFAAILHDMARVCDFGTLERSNFDEEITEEKWKNWENMRQEYDGKRHEQLASDYLKKPSPIVAEMIRLHRSTCLVEEYKSFDTLEKKILYYSDKRVKHDEIVDLEERFRDGKERYAAYNTDETEAVFEEIRKKTYALEEELFAPLKIGPQNIA